MTSLTRCVAIAVAVCVAGQPAWGHNFPAARTVVIQVERCELAVMIGYRPASGEATDAIVGRIASHPKSRRLEAARRTLASHALAPLRFAVGDKPLNPTEVRVKLGVDPTGTRPLVVVLVTLAIPDAGALEVISRDPRTTRISWVDRDSGRVDHEQAPGQGRWFTGVASFLLSLTAPPGVSACARPSSP